MAATPPISAVIIARDAASSIAATLDSLAAFAEVLLYDNGSTDGTLAIARGYPNVVIHCGEFHGFGPTKRLAASLAAHDWILAIDADEAVSAELCASIFAAALDDERTVYSVQRVNHFMGRAVRHSGWDDDWLLRLFNRRATGYDDALVHEKVRPVAGGNTVRLSGPLHHQAVTGVGDFLVKVNRYSELRRGQPPRSRSSAAILLRAAWAFFRTLVLRRGFLDGWRGVVIAVSDANGVFFKLMKPYADERVRRERDSGQ
ncbi:MAG: beta 1,4 glucosyltransferase [Gammaproteobacteria bacterium]|nr:MAG: glycosyltransferase family 2 protein [Pseudomonadota bacterium]MBC6946303.1 glycosyltransferase family 2 protein [Gammaproteobacteria bacterium]MCE7897205.1 glycosyltransferase family 2 protein [Gammaproteobacteria bacterium PRO8]MDL1881943.1 glycosyltransferase family 2 protein [Gammaproteobacteria bacterium PRO2]MCL4778543.1 glycosyltransferase family 2 protein [Gammaproteobacteria bacterium]